MLNFNLEKNPFESPDFSAHWMQGVGPMSRGHFDRADERFWGAGRSLPWSWVQSHFLYDFDVHRQKCVKKFPFNFFLSNKWKILQENLNQIINHLNILSKFLKCVNSKSLLPIPDLDMRVWTSELSQTTAAYIPICNNFFLIFLAVGTYHLHIWYFQGFRKINCLWKSFIQEKRKISYKESNMSNFFFIRTEPNSNDNHA